MPSERAIKWTCHVRITRTITNSGTLMYGATSSGSVQASPGPLPAFAAAATQDSSSPAVLFIADAIHCSAAGQAASKGHRRCGQNKKGGMAMMVSLLPHASHSRVHTIIHVTACGNGAHRVSCHRQ